ncbi:MAG TPA: NFACT RNA binding domain-containing protein [Bacillota bacterium]|nr:NFACT RNA binding domain-containing protein [Bacillota bacterium]
MPFDGIVTKAVTEELTDQFVPGKITKIYQPTETELILTIRSKRKNHDLLISIHPTYARIHLTNDQYKNPQEPPMFCMVLRKHLAGAIVEKIEQDRLERIITFSLQSRNEIGDQSQKTLIVEIMGKHSNVMLVDPAEGHIIDSMKHISSAQNRYRTVLPGSIYQPPPPQEKLNPLIIDGDDFIKKLDFNAGKLDRQIVQTLLGLSPFIAKELVHRTKLGSPTVFKDVFNEFQRQLNERDYTPAILQNHKDEFHVLPITSFQGEITTFSSTNEMLDQFYSGKAERDRVMQQTRDLHRFIKNEREKNERKLKKHQQTIKKAKRAPALQKKGELLTAHMHLVSQGDSEVTVVDYYDPEQREMTISLDPTKTPSENAQNFFRRYRKLTNSKRIIEREIVKTKAEIKYFDQLLHQLDTANIDDVEEIREELREEGYLKKQRRNKRKKRKKPTPESYESSDGTTILVGKNNKQNEYLTMRIAHRDDVWLHTKDIPGSHVVIREKNPSDKTLLEAAMLAAYFSKSRDSSSVPVDYTTIRYVKKPKGAKPGFVTYEQQKTLFVTPEMSTVKKLKKIR